MEKLVFGLEEEVTILGKKTVSNYLYFRVIYDGE